MSRIASQPITIPTGVDVTVNRGLVKIKGPKGELFLTIDPFVVVSMDDNQLKVKLKKDLKVRCDENPRARAIAGTTRALMNNMVDGVTKGFEKKLLLVGVGYRAAVKGKVLNLSLGFSHPVNHPIPEGISIETPDQTTVIVKGIDRQVVGQVSAEIRSYRPPEPYKGKGVRYADEHVKRKETKKK